MRPTLDVGWFASGIWVIDSTPSPGGLLYNPQNVWKLRRGGGSISRNQIGIRYKRAYAGTS